MASEKEPLECLLYILEEGRIILGRKNSNGRVKIVEIEIEV